MSAWLCVATPARTEGRGGAGRLNAPERTVGVLVHRHRLPVDELRDASGAAHEHEEAVGDGALVCDHLRGGTLHLPALLRQLDERFR
jgi:hypothetical protein